MRRQLMGRDGNVYLREALWGGPLSKRLCDQPWVSTAVTSVLVDDDQQAPYRFEPSAGIKTSIESVALQTAELMLAMRPGVQWDALFEHPYSRPTDPFTVEDLREFVFVDNAVFVHVQTATASSLQSLLLRAHVNVGTVAIRPSTKATTLDLDEFVEHVLAFAVPVYDYESWLVAERP
jgi:hypothetical protein